MTDADLSTYIPIYGDRLAVLNFCKSYGKKKDNVSKKKKAVKALKKTLGFGHKRRKDDSNSDSSDDNNSNTGMQRIGNQNAARKTRTIQIGWLHRKCSEVDYSQKRQDHGGKARSVCVSKTAVKGEILAIGKSLFFPKGISKAGPEHLFEFDVKDFQHSDIPEDETVGEIFERTKLATLRLYLATSEKAPEVEKENESKKTEKDINNLLMTSKEDDEETHKFAKVKNTKFFKTKIVCLQNSDSDSCKSLPDLLHEPEMAEILEDIRTSEEQYKWNSPLPSTMTVMDEIVHMKYGPKSPNKTLSETLPWNGIETREIQASSTPVHDWLTDDVICISANTDVPFHELCIRRGFALEDMLEAFEHDPSLGQTDISLQIQRLLPTGEIEPASDLGGVLKDTLTEFWSNLYERCTIGAKVKVPFLRHDFGNSKWDAIGRILIVGYKVVNYFPALFSPTFIRQIVSGSPDTSFHDEDEVIADYLDFISPTEGSAIKEALHDFEKADMNELMDIFDEHKARRQPNPQNLRKTVLELAVKELIQEPMFVIDTWRRHFHKLAFKVCDIKSMYDKFIPTPRSVIHLLEFPINMSEGQKQVSKFLKKFLLEIELAMLFKFLRFVTGSDVITTTTIAVEFNKLSGLASRPIGHTCSCSLEIPESYDSYPDFRSQFTGVLTSNIWVMDIV